MEGLEGQVVLVTGAGANGGIGHALALGFAEAGARLVLADQDAQGLAATRDTLASRQVPVLARQTDTSREEDVAALFAALVAHYGRLDVMIHVPFAFPSRVKPHQLALDDWRRTQRVSLEGCFLCCRAAIRQMLAQTPPGGNIINIGSNAGLSALGRGAAPYGAAKAGVHELTRELAVEYAASGIRVNALVPAQVLTPGLRAHLDKPHFRDQVLPVMMRGLPQQRLLDPEDLVGPALFLASSAARAVNGVLLPVDQGNSALNAGGSHNWPGPEDAVINLVDK